MTPLLRCAVAALAFVIAPGCSANRYAGVDLRPHGAPVDVQTLARAARKGDKEAQLALGIRLEAGNGVKIDRVRAIELYRAAAQDEQRNTWIYSPSPGGGAPSRPLPIDRGTASLGLVEAKVRLARLLVQATGEKQAASSAKAIVQ